MKAKIVISPDFIIDQVDKRIYGSFIEHLGRAVYGGIYEPSHPSADADGFRQDVLEQIRKLNIPIIRYPGGNFVSGYRWEDGIGDRSERPIRPELAWGSIEMNQFGTDDFIRWSQKADAQVMMAVNLGTRGVEDAKNLLEYCNFKGGTYYSELRRKNGFATPFGIKTWCLGNEMDGEWQIGHKTAEEYGRLACETAKAMKWLDDSIELVVCGSSNQFMPTFGEWERTVLEHTYEFVDYISLHSYYFNEDGNSAKFLARSVQMDRFIESVEAVCDSVQALKKSSKKMYLSFDEWNIWLACNGHSDSFEPWQTAPHQLEDVYTFEDALVSGCLMNSLINHCDRVKIACLAQLVNVIAPIMTEDNGKCWVQTIYYPFFYASNYARGTALDIRIDCPGYDADDLKAVPYLDAACVYNKEAGEVIILAVNRSLDESIVLELCAYGLDTLMLTEHIALENSNLKARNTKDMQEVSPIKKKISGTIELEKHSWNMLRFKIT